MHESNVLMRDWLIASQKCIVNTGAGMSTESGIPDFRSQSGWWNNIDPSTVATIEALENHYTLFHEFYSMRIRALENIFPHEGHSILADFEKVGLIDSIATQNVDGLHQVAGNTRVEELHGTIRSIRCHKCMEGSSIEAFLKMESCHACGGKLRPNVVLFGENLPEASWFRTIDAIKAADLVIVIGTSLEVYPVNQLPLMTSGKTIYINLDMPTSNKFFDLKIQGKAKNVLQQVKKLL